MRSLSHRTIWITNGAAAFGLLFGSLAGVGEAGSVRRGRSIDERGQQASSIARGDDGGGSPQVFPSFAAPFTPGAQNSEPFPAPGVQHTPRFDSFATPGVQNTPQFRSFATPGVQNLPSRGSGSGATVWNQPSNPWSSGSWNTAPAVPAPQRLAHAERATWSQPQTLSTLRPTSSPPAPIAGPQVSGGTIRIRMPDWESAGCSYVLQDDAQAWSYVMRPGKSQSFPHDRAWAITFDRGGGLGTKSYRLEPGQYVFRQTTQGWQLFRDRSASAGAVAFAP